MTGADKPDVAWLRRNLVEIVHLAALQLHAKSDTFTLRDLVKLSRDFYRDKRLPDSLIASVLADAQVEGDLETGRLRLAA